MLKNQDVIIRRQFMDWAAELASDAASASVLPFL
jgi:hypothetical protein